MTVEKETSQLEVTNQTISEKQDLLEAFNDQVVEPMNHTRQTITEDDCLSYL